MKTSLSTELVTGCGRTVTLAEVTQVYRDIVNTSIPKSGRIKRLGDNAFSFTIRYTTVDCDTSETINSFKIYSLTTKPSNGSDGSCFESVRCISDMHAANDILSATSDNGRFLARIKNNDKAVSGSLRRQLLEIWSCSRLVKTVDTSELDVHGAIIVDPVFSSFAWNPADEQDKLLYVCQPARDKHLSFFKEPDLMDVNRGEAYNRKRDWGECLNGIEHTLIGILDVADKCHVRTINMDGYSLASPQWLDNGAKIVSVAYKEEPRLGLIYCNNRPSKIVIHECQTHSDGQLILVLELEGQSLHTPRVNHQGNKFLYLSNPTYGAHRHSVKLHLYDLETRSSKPLVDEEREKKDRFIESVPTNCFTTNDRNILFVDSDNSSTFVCIMNIETLRCFDYQPMTGFTILDFRHDIVLAMGSRIVATPTIFVAVLNLDADHYRVGWHIVEEGNRMSAIKYEAFTIEAEESENQKINGILVEPDLLKAPYRDRLKSQDSSQLPTIVYIHGGPNAAFLRNYQPLLVFDARLGFKTLIINYRGSTGVSEENVQSICGKVSELDVSDCLRAIRLLVEKERIDPTKLVLRGGSHGGFIAAHLSCNDEFKFLSAVIRNPVIDMSSMRGTTDIPDWCYTMALGHKNYDASRVPTSDELVELFKRSPISTASKAYVPTLMLLGKNDRRVNMYQGELWVDTLRARGVETLCKIYDDQHSLENSMNDWAITAAIWMLNHLPRTS